MGEDIRGRKRKHLEICLDESLGVETGETGLDAIGLRHMTMPGTNPAAIDLSTEFLGHRLMLPVLISCMTGGSEEGRRLNALLAETAGREGIAIGTGSIRVMIEHPETRPDFEFKRRAPDSPVLANIGAAQLVEFGAERILDAAESIGADGLYVHLNPAQEFFQSGGDRDFTGWRNGIMRLLESARRRGIPILAKETGSGIPPIEGLVLLDSGVAYVDVAGSGGTDWIAVESHRSVGKTQEAAAAFTGWGYSTGELLLAYRQIVRAGGESGRTVEGRIIASGGLRSPRDFAVSLACGARLAAAALPFARRAAADGPDGVSSYIQAIAEGIRAAASLTGAATLAEFRSSRLRVPRAAAEAAEELAEDALASRDGRT